MKIQYCSDLHMEFHENMRFMKSLPLEPVGDVLVIAGDVGYLVDSTIPHLRFWKWASENYRQVLMIAGNHEFYNNGDIVAQGDSWQNMFLPNVGYYHNKWYASTMSISFSQPYGQEYLLSMSSQFRMA